MQAALRREVPLSELCQRFGISRKSGDKMLQRHAEEGLPGLRDASRAPKSGLANRPLATLKSDTQTCHAQFK